MSHLGSVLQCSTSLVTASGWCNKATKTKKHVEPIKFPPKKCEESRDFCCGVRFAEMGKFLFMAMFTTPNLVVLSSKGLPKKTNQRSFLDGLLFWPNTKTFFGDDRNGTNMAGLSGSWTWLVEWMWNISFAIGTVDGSEILHRLIDSLSIFLPCFIYIPGRSFDFFPWTVVEKSNPEFPGQFLT